MTSITAWLAKSRKPGMLDKVMSCISPSHTASCPCICHFVATVSTVSTVSTDHDFTPLALINYGYHTHSIPQKQVHVCLFVYLPLSGRRRSRRQEP